MLTDPDTIKLSLVLNCIRRCEGIEVMFGLFNKIEYKDTTSYGKLMDMFNNRNLISTNNSSNSSKSPSPFSGNDDL